MTAPSHSGAVAVAAPHPAALEAARAAVARGGNAVDAALAAAAALTVVYPHQCSLGGDLVALVRHPGGQVRAVLSAGAAAEAVDVAALRAADDRMPAQGPQTVTVPGAVAGWTLLASLAGTDGALCHALRDAAALASDGSAVSAGLARAIAGRADAVRADPGLSALFAGPEGGLLAEGATLRQPRLAAVLDALADDPDAFYRGGIADALAAGLRTAGSPLTAADLAAHQGETAEPLLLDAGSARWWAAPPPFQGATLLAVLNAAAVGGLPADLIELCHSAAAARDLLLGDPRRAPVDLAGLIRPAPVPVGAAPAPLCRPAGDTVAVTAVDTSGLAVSLIQSVYQTFGSGICDPGTGIVLHNRGSAFSLAPGHPALIGPGLRPPHTLCPVLAETPDLLLAAGCQGGRAQPQILAQTAPALLDGIADPAAVLARPRWVIGSRDIGHPAPTLLAEPGSPAAEAGPALAGLPVAVTGGPSDLAGHVQAVRLAAGRLDAASDPRADGGALVLTGPVR
ncbi:gamma-glutamyltransferase [Streptomyces sp. NPDC059373]